MENKTAIDLFVLAGQSNIQGYMGNAKMYPPDFGNIDRLIPFFYVTPAQLHVQLHWTSLGSQPGRFPAGYFGPEVTFARELFKAGLKPGVFKFSASNTSLPGQWLANQTEGLYFRMKEKLSYAIACLDMIDVTVRAFIWVQGETDAKQKTSGPEYYASLKYIIDDFRSQVAFNDQLPVILGLDENNPFVIEYPEIQLAQQQLTHDLKKTFYCSMKGFPRADLTHLSPAGIELHGLRLFQTFIQLQSREEEDCA